ncbi:PREDICTED: mediator of RNA polymerase II transcription subunit 20b-like [Camelina sativa]|uniref:Mediator of RNA polymerase II transcription subunit 20b-like n=1 Tax=Camelina sativa TaxID=90675 RepID=A0ABM1QSV4_CAMSA|nr:PREDICTED: mediator of RNA polymerase II transcription subunit 20b-like [Camelina sativa]
MGMARKVKEEFLEIWEEAMSKRSLPGKFKNIDFNFGMFELGDNYSPKHTAVRYAFFVGNLMAAIKTGF